MKYTQEISTTFGSTAIKFSTNNNDAQRINPTNLCGKMWYKYQWSSKAELTLMTFSILT